ncbi:MAG: Membrane associated domain containing protein [Haloplasmataceae bacterium]|jgi:diguanylate cyclase|nr:Membrane associated domain containing protein [Haloplasmataceae bacterium]
MIYNLFISILIFTFFILLGAQMTREIPLNRHSKIKTKILYGLSGSFMNFAFTILEIEDSIFFINSGFMSVILIYNYGGIISASITGLCVIIYLLLKAGFSSLIIFLSLVLLISFVLIAISEKFFSNRWKRWSSWLFVLILVNISLVYYNKDYFPDLLKNIIVTSLTGIFIFHLIKYLESTQTLFVKYKTEALYDYLTGLKNSRSFDIQFNKVAEESKLTNQSVAVLMIDIDFFKNINDTYGHEVGDKILKEFGSILKTNCHINDVVSRIGGEEFCLIIYCGKEKALIIGETIRKAVEEYEFYNKKNDKIHITVSIGIAVYPDTTSKINDLRSNADDAVYLAKHQGRNKVCII